MALILRNKNRGVRVEADVLFFPFKKSVVGDHVGFSDLSLFRCKDC